MPLVPSDGVGLCEELYEIYKSLSEGTNFRNMVDDMSDLLMENCRAGNRIPRDRVPEYYRKKYGVNNLYRWSHGMVPCPHSLLRIDNAFTDLLGPDWLHDACKGKSIREAR